jgi:translation initiation factor IF-3
MQVRVNHRIRVPEVRVIAADGTQLGILASHEAIRMAQEQGLDLVEVNPKAEPPVCKIMDFGKFKYEEKKKANEAKKKQNVVEIKEVKVRPKTDDHDLETKIKHIRRFLEEGNKAKITVRFRGREITHPEKGREVIDEILKALEGLIIVEGNPMMEGKAMTVMIAPKPGMVKPKAPVPGQPAAQGGQH